MAGNNKVTVDMTTGIGILSFPHLMSPTKNDKGEDIYDLQFIIPKSQREDARKILAAIKEVGEAKWGANWKKVRSPLRDGDREKDELTEDGSTKGEKYPERLGCYFLNARSTRPVGVYDRQRNLITDESEVYSGCKVKVALSFYPYSVSGNNGIGVGINGVQKIADGEQIGGGGKPSIDSMFDLLDDDEDLGLDDDLLDDEVEEEVEEKPVRRTAKKAAPAKKAAAPRKRAAAKPVEVEIDEDEDDLYDDLDDLDDED